MNHTDLDYLDAAEIDPSDYMRFPRSKNRLDHYTDQPDYVVQRKIEEVIKASNVIATVTLPSVVGRQRLSDELKQLALEQLALLEAALLEAKYEIQRRQDGTRRIKPQAQSLVEPQPTLTVLDTKPTPIAITFKTIDVGTAFMGTYEDTVLVPVTMRPTMHQSVKGKWSWRTKVHGHDDFRHINVNNFHSSVVDNVGNYYVRVDSKWKTDQVVFRDVCNK